jgi:hypothetical protein
VTAAAAALQPADPQGAVQPQHHVSGSSGQQAAASGGYGANQPYTSGGSLVDGSRTCMSGLQNADSGLASTEATALQGTAGALPPRSTRSRRSGHRRKSGSRSTPAAGSDSDSESDVDEIGDVTASNFSGVAAEAQQMCSDAHTRWRHTAQWTPQGLAALDHAFAGIVQVRCFSHHLGMRFQALIRRLPSHLCVCIWSAWAVHRCSDVS